MTRSSTALKIFFVLLVQFTVLADWQPTNGPFGGVISSFACLGKDLFTATSNGVFLSRDSGVSWQASSNGLGDNHSGFFAIIGSIIFSATSGGIYRSSDSGANWVEVHTFGQVTALASNNSDIFAGTAHGVYQSRDTGATWIAEDSFPYSSQDVRDIVCKDSTIYACNWNGVYCMTKSGTWGKPLSGYFEKLTVCGGYVIAGGNGSGIYRSSNGTTWENVKSGGYVAALCSDGTSIFMGTPDGYIYESDDYGYNWSIFGSVGTEISALSTFGSNIFAGTQGAGVFRSSKTVANWTLTNNGLRNACVKGLLWHKSNLFAGVLGGNLYSSSTNGDNWQIVNTNTNSLQIEGFVSNGNNIFIGSYIGGIYRSFDNGLSFNSASTGLTDEWVFSLASDGIDLFAGTMNGGVFVSVDSGSHWISHNKIYRTNAVAVQGARIYAGTDTGGVLTSINKGITWTPANNGLTCKTIEVLAVHGTKIFAGTYYNDVGCVFISSDSGQNWTNAGLTDVIVNDMTFASDNIFVGTEDNGLFYSNDSVFKWAPAKLADSHIKSLAVNDTFIFAGTEYNGLWRCRLTELGPTALRQAQASSSPQRCFPAIRKIANVSHASLKKLNSAYLIFDIRGCRVRSMNSGPVGGVYFIKETPSQER